MDHTVSLGLSSKHQWPYFMHLCGSLKLIFFPRAWDFIYKETQVATPVSLFHHRHWSSLSGRKPAGVSVYCFRCRFGPTKGFWKVSFELSAPSKGNNDTSFVGKPPVEAAANPGWSCIRCLLLGLEPRWHLPDRLWTWRLLWAVALECSGNISTDVRLLLLHDPILPILSPSVSRLLWTQ